MRGVRLVVLGLVVVASQALMPAITSAQVKGLGRINGIVVDESGNPIEGVKITTKTALGAEIDAQSDAKGSWVVPGLGKGLWEVDFVKDGFTRVKAKVTIEKELSKTEPIKITLKKL
ncbi:MAG TPA: carboxypeptidase-like regulatory domain-containing protein [Vicinamibacterales bacterium]